MSPYEQDPYLVVCNRDLSANMILVDPSVNAEHAAKLPDADIANAVPTTVKDKWQGAVTDGSGFVAIPMALLRLQAGLKLTATDMIVLVNLLAHWWDPTRAVFPRSTTIARRMGVAKRTVQRSTQKMVKAGLIDREFLTFGDGKRRTFQFTSLAARLAKDINLSHQLAGKESLGV